MAANRIRLAVGQRLLRLRPLIRLVCTAVPQQQCYAAFDSQRCLFLAHMRSADMRQQCLLTGELQT
jgi:hypothetical protein